MRTADGRPYYAEYRSFSVGDERSDYTLHVDGYSGDAGEYYRGNTVIIVEGS